MAFSDDEFSSHFPDSDENNEFDDSEDSADDKYDTSFNYDDNDDDYGGNSSDTPPFGMSANDSDSDTDQTEGGRGEVHRLSVRWQIHFANDANNLFKKYNFFRIQQEKHLVFIIK